MLVVSAVFIIGDILFPLLGVSGFSELMKSWAFDKGFALAWIWGVLAGHLFFFRSKDARILDEVLAISILVIVTLILLCIACFCDLAGHEILNLILLGTGCVAGHLLWPQWPPEA